MTLVELFRSTKSFAIAAREVDFKHDSTITKLAQRAKLRLRNRKNIHAISRPFAKSLQLATHPKMADQNAAFPLADEQLQQKLLDLTQQVRTTSLKL